MSDFRIPKMAIKECKGLSAQEVQELTTELKKRCEENLGEVMMYPVLLCAEVNFLLFKCSAMHFS